MLGKCQIMDHCLEVEHEPYPDEELRGRLCGPRELQRSLDLVEGSVNRRMWM